MMPKQTLLGWLLCPPLHEARLAVQHEGARKKKKTRSERSSNFLRIIKTFDGCFHTTSRRIYFAFESWCDTKPIFFHFLSFVLLLHRARQLSFCSAREIKCFRFHSPSRLLLETRFFFGIFQNQKKVFLLFPPFLAIRV